jgi:catechol 2,3-dioxygenase-like lactoylglutathione lyase family enzyme
VRIGHVVVPADEIEAQVGFYTGLGLSLRFRDGDRYAAVSDGVATIGLAGTTEQPVAGRTVVALEVEDLEATLARLDAQEVPHGLPEVGPHELRTVVTDPGGNPVVLYERRP